MVLVHGSVVAKEGRFAEVLALSQAHVHRSRQEPGCIAHAVHQDTENALRLVFVEQWSSQEVLKQHFRVPASKAFIAALSELASERPSITVYEATAIDVAGKSSD